MTQQEPSPGPSQIQFTPPPGWPAPPSPTELPPQGWVPDPGWPPAPAGWSYYRDGAGTSVAPPPGAWTPPSVTGTGPDGTGKKRRLGLWITVGVIVLALVVGGGIAAFVLLTGKQEMTSERFKDMVDAGTIAGVEVKSPQVETEIDWPQNAEDADQASCATMFTFFGDHLNAIGQGTSADKTYAEVMWFDSADSAQDASDKIAACRDAQSPTQACVWTSGSASDADGASVRTWSLEPGPNSSLTCLGEAYEFEIDNLHYWVANREGGTLDDPATYVSAAKAEIAAAG